MVVIWGSQSGTAERMANRLAKEIRQRFGINVLSADLSDYDSSSIAAIPKAKLAVFIMSTFGEGDPSDNAHDLWAWLGESSNVSLENLHYMAFGLGNSNYKYYNKVIDVVAERLNTLGAEPLLPTGRADDAKGETEEHYLDWKDQVFATLREKLGHEERGLMYEPAIKVVEDESLEPIDLHHGGPWNGRLGKKTQTTLSPVLPLPVRSARELFSASESRNCLHMELDLSEYPGMKYKTGDHLGVWPMNPRAEVQTLLRTLGLAHRRQVPVSVTSLETGTICKVPSPTSLDALFGHYLEICAPVSREAIAYLIQFAPTQSAKEFLARFSGSKEAYAEFLSANYVTLGRLLSHSANGEGAWSSLPLSFVVEILPAMQPRYYSISSSSVVQPRQAAITAVVSDTLFSGSDERIPGLSTNYMLALKESLQTSAQPHPRGLTYMLQGPQDALQGGKLFAHIRKSTFKLPTLGSQPLVMVAAGTGLAPFRAFLQERARVLAMGREVGKMLLFFGCRNENTDYIYRDELAALKEKLRDSLEVITAFSRPDDGRKVYVQDRIGENAEQVCELLHDSNAYFYICGSANMARDVSNVIGGQLRQRQGWDEEELKAYTERQKRQKRWQQDVWG